MYLCIICRTGVVVDLTRPDEPSAPLADQARRGCVAPWLRHAAAPKDQVMTFRSEELDEADRFLSQI